MFDDWVVVWSMSCFSIGSKTPFLYTASHFATGEAPGVKPADRSLARSRTRWHLSALGSLCCYTWLRIVWVVNMLSDERYHVPRTLDAGKAGIKYKLRHPCCRLDFDFQDVRLRWEQHSEL